MQIKTMMSQKVATVGPDQSIQEAAMLMQSLNVKAIPVCTGGILTGMITDHDITQRVLANGMNPENTLIGDVSFDRNSFCRENQTIREAAQMMEKEQIGRLPVIDAEQRLVGVLSWGDLAVKGLKRNISPTHFQVA